jgi:hypothetical protein
MATFSIFRSTQINAPAATVHDLISDYRRWVDWSPWEGIDPNLERTYSGADAGVGAKYAWVGNKKVGSGNMETTSDEPHRIELRLEFTAPWKAVNSTVFDLAETGGVTLVTWTMTGKHEGLRGLLMRLMPMDKFVGKDFEKGLAQLKGLAEGA